MLNVHGVAQQLVILHCQNLPQKRQRLNKLQRLQDTFSFTLSFWGLKSRVFINVNLTPICCEIRQNKPAFYSRRFSLLFARPLNVLWALVNLRQFDWLKDHQYLTVFSLLPWNNICLSQPTAATLNGAGCISFISVLKRITEQKNEIQSLKHFNSHLY